MSCEAEESRVDQLSAQVSQKAAYSSMICATQGYDSIECQGSRGEVDDLRARLREAQNALAECKKGEMNATSTRLLQIGGNVTFLLVVEPGTGYGGGETNWIDADVIFKLDSRADKSFGFRLRADESEPVRAGWLNMLRTALVHSLRVTADYNELELPPNANSFILRLALAEPVPPQTSDLPTVKG